jgi:hypothetical protein
MTCRCLSAAHLRTGIRYGWPADNPPASDKLANAINSDAARSRTTDYFACMTLMSAMRPVAWQTMQVSTVPSPVARAA